MFAIFAVVLACGGFLLFIYLIGGYQYDRAKGVAAWASREIEWLSEQVQEAAPEGAILTNSWEPHSYVYHTALSAGSTQYASASAEQEYNVQLSLDVILAHYDRLFTGWGWSLTPLDSDTGRNGDVGSLKRVYRHPDNEHLLVGLCQPEPAISPSTTQYRVFFDFDEIPGNALYSDAISKIIYWYCGGYE